MIVERRGARFDPAICDAFLRIVQGLRATAPRRRRTISSPTLSGSTCRGWYERRVSNRPNVRDAADRRAGLRLGGGAVGAAALVASRRWACPSTTAVLFAVLLGLAILTSAAKIDLPLGRSQSNLSLSHAVNFWALFALGLPRPSASPRSAPGRSARCAPAASRNPLHRIVFSISSLTLTSWIAGCRWLR